MRRQPNLFEVRFIALDLIPVEANLEVVLKRLNKLASPQEAVLHNETVLRTGHSR
jgi:hypothetical protein